jgi:hypothetical protein
VCSTLIMLIFFLLLILLFCDLVLNNFHFGFGIYTHWHMITDDQLAFFSNVLGSAIFVLIVVYHYLVSQPVSANSHSTPSAASHASAASSIASSSSVSGKEKKTQ